MRWQEKGNKKRDDHPSKGWCRIRARTRIARIRPLPGRADKKDDRIENGGKDDQQYHKGPQREEDAAKRRKLGKRVPVENRESRGKTN